YLRLSNLKEIQTLAASHLQEHKKAVNKITLTLQQIAKELTELHSENVSSPDKSLNLTGFFSGFLSSHYLTTIKKTYLEYLKTKKVGQNSLKTSWCYKTAKQKFRSLLSHIRYKEYQCWKLRIKHSKTL